LKVGVDFDRVLFNTKEFKKKLFSEIDGFDRTYSRAEDDHGVYDPKKHAEILGIDVSRIHGVLAQASDFVYSDIDKLEELSSETVVIVSRGDPHFQAEKIENSGVLEHVDDYIVVHDGSKDQKVDIDFLVDDTEDEIERVDLPEDNTFLFSREKNDLEDVVERVKRLE